MIRFSCHSENFGIKSAQETFSFIRALGYECVDVAARSLAPQSRILEEPIRTAQQLRACAQENELVLSELFLSAVEVDGKPVDPALSGTIGNDVFFRNFDTICKFAKEAGFLSIMGAGGNPQENQCFDESLESTGLVLQKQSVIAAQYGIAMHIEPTRTSLIREPENAEKLIELAPGLKYTLDFLHYHVNGVGLDRSIRLLPHAGHMHIRPARFKVGKCRFEDNGVDYDAIVREMKTLAWSGDVCTEFWTDEKLLAQEIYAVEQNILMRYHFDWLMRKYNMK